MTHIVTATLLSLSPLPADYAAAHSDLTSPADAPPLTERSPRMRLAMLTALHHLGGLDADAKEFAWFGPRLGWASEIGCARGVVAVARTAPGPDWLPPREWFAAQADYHSGAAGVWRQRAAEYRERVTWEADRTEALHAWARHFDTLADAHGDISCRYSRWSGASWSCPRAVVCVEVRDWLGPAWDRRAWPE